MGSCTWHHIHNFDFVSALFCQNNYMLRYIRYTPPAWYGLTSAAASSSIIRSLAGSSALEEVSKEVDVSALENFGSGVTFSFGSWHSFITTNKHERIRKLIKINYDKFNLLPNIFDTNPGSLPRTSFFRFCNTGATGTFEASPDWPFARRIIAAFRTAATAWLGRTKLMSEILKIATSF